MFYWWLCVCVYLNVLCACFHSFRFYFGAHSFFASPAIHFGSILTLFRVVYGLVLRTERMNIKCWRISSCFSFTYWQYFLSCSYNITYHTIVNEILHYPDFAMHLIRNPETWIIFTIKIIHKLIFCVFVFFSCYFYGRHNGTE